MSEPMPPSRQADDVIDSRRILLVGVLTLAVFAAAIGLLALWLLGRGGLQVPAQAPRVLGQAEVGLVDQQPFWTGRAELVRGQQRERLHSYGWVDRSRGLIHIPIDRAMERVLEDANR
jgi:hypothetical protein